jgi:hypothetical protein
MTCSADLAYAMMNKTFRATEGQQWDGRDVLAPSQKRLLRTAPKTQIGNTCGTLQLKEHPHPAVPQATNEKLEGREQGGAPKLHVAELSELGTDAS